MRYQHTVQGLDADFLHSAGPRGLISGSYFFLYAGPSLVSWMRRIILVSVSIVGLLSGFLLPFWIAVISVLLSLLWLMVPPFFIQELFFAMWHRAYYDLFFRRSAL